MERHKSYRIAKRLIDSGDCKELRDVFEPLPVTVVAKDLGVSVDRLAGLIENVEDFRFRELYKLAELIGVEGKVLIDLADAQHEKDKKKRKK